MASECNYLKKVEEYREITNTCIFSLVFLLLPLYPLIKWQYVCIFLVLIILNISSYKKIEKSEALLCVAIIYAFVISIASLDYSAYKSSISWVILLPFYLAVCKSSNKEIIIKLIFVISFFFSIDAIYQYFNGSDFFGKELVFNGRASGPFAWHSPVIGNFIMALFFVPEIVLKRPRDKLLVYCIFILAILVAGTRGAILQIMFCIFMIAVNLRTKFLLIGLGLIFSIYIIPIIIPHIESDTLLRVLQLANISDAINYESRGSGRLAFWGEYLPTIASDNILTGSGLGGLEPYLLNLTGNYIHPHHLYLEIIFSFGIIGSIFFIFYLIYLYMNGNTLSRCVLLSFWGPFNALHSIFDFYWAIMMFINLFIVRAINESVKK